MKTQAVALVIAAALLAAPPAFAEKKHDNHAGHTQLDAHEHGHGKLNIAIEGKTLAIELEIPAADIIGFEHAAETEDQKAKLADAKVKLGKPLELFVVNAQAKCAVTSAEVEAGGAIAGDGRDHGKQAAEAGGSHSEFHATYQMTCAAPDKLTSIQFAFFGSFPNSEELEVAVVGDKGTKQIEATPKNATLTFGGSS